MHESFSSSIQEKEEEIETQKPKTKFAQTAKNTQTNRHPKILTYRRPKSTLLATNSTFGKDAPKISIGCPRPKPIITNNLPGPGAYNPLNTEHTRKIYHKISKSVDVPRKKITSDIDFINYRMFPQYSPQTIPKTCHSDYYDYDSSIPGPQYNPRPIYTSYTHKILDRRPERSASEDVPGPGYYSPKYDDYRGYFYTSNAKRSTDIIPTDDSPGPGAYNPNFNAEIEGMPKWSFGKKARNRIRKKHEPPEVPKGKLIGVAQFLIPLEPTMDEDEVLKFIGNHPDLKKVITEMMDEVLKYKPDYPLEFIHNHYAAMKMQKEE